MWRAVSALCLFVVAGAILSAAQDCRIKELEAKNLSVDKVYVEGGGQFNAPAAAMLMGVVRNTEYFDPCETSLDEMKERLRGFFQNYGHVRVVVKDAIFHPAAAHKVNLIFTVDPGPIYWVADIEFENVTAFPAQELGALFAIYPGNFFATGAITNGLETLRRLYSSKGYVNCVAVPDMQIDDTSKTIKLLIDVDEGPVFTIGPLVLDGVEPAAGVGKKLLTAWQPLAGKPYDPVIVARFLQSNASLFGTSHFDVENMLQITLDKEARVALVKLVFPN
jgi:hypothetical protein